ncbi:hypothetical protein AD45P2_00035 [Alteromonas phage vB_AmaP_AD45-P2]|uniref:Uncharacterized protein n=2 Tax=Pseudomonadota TaxID=1224 RepID=A0A922T5C4_9HYPH|nr:MULTISPECIES: hypothetical protein [Pseudomonadota]YP_008125978.1 hypothetical protein M610_gp007 [Alteromonas phage vB_AmaP_AD45-P1]AGM46945.1 hypothetical protein AD45P3_00035 [Alteromonas phage vB_AmaP_AD45-P3]AGM47062.1 hypothetical protein AD45P4_00035 [Alteromonas phage vB_AmaP_AD45-P4]AGM47178.1 hypothetical protein AD45P2_00035 [Alteromonas phage vB_AmaP_AD45-P2]AGM46825.1 hypothetical protein AD45P1_00035 [Alteromonas phage vB_AmaP_AD45-P1]KEQ05583.1 hypothetical protein GV68_0861
MACSTNKFTITKGTDNYFNFTIKADGSTLPMTIDGTDTFIASLYPLDPSKPAAVIENKVLTVSDALSGRIELLITAEETAALEMDKGSKADRYYSRPNYRLVIECNTVNNGNFIAKVPEVYVD